MIRWERNLSALLIFMCVTLLSACSNDNDELGMSLPTDKSILVGSSFSFGFSGDWSSSNDFVASVDNNGNVGADHVGECTISNGKYNCRINVTPKTYFIKEPITDWEISKSQIISKCGLDYKVTGNSIGYISNSSIAPITLYTFDNNERLSSAAVVVKTDYTTDLVDFLTERYQSIGMEGYDFYFANGYTPQKISTVVGVSLYKYDKNYWIVLYIPYNYSSRSLISTDISSILSNIIEK